MRQQQEKGEINCTGAFVGLQKGIFQGKKSDSNRTKFEAENAGKMQLYLSVLDKQAKLPEKNPSIGIIICKSKYKIYAEYVLKNR